MKKVICSFANSRYVSALDRLQHQINRIKFFDHSFLYSESDLSDDFRLTNKHYLKENSRGFGYWIWKPYIILDTLSKMNDGDCLLYIDAGCHINAKGTKRLSRYFDILESSESGIIGFQLGYHEFCAGFFRRHVSKSNYFKERNWTKGDLLDYFGVRDNLSIVDTPQVLSGIILIRKSKSTVEFVQNWAKVYKENFHLIDDSVSLSPNLDGFIENRHDQSVFSILCKQGDVSLFSTDEVEGEESIVRDFPILALRDIGGRMPYKSYLWLKITRVIKSPYLIICFFRHRKPKLL